MRSFVSLLLTLVALPVSLRAQSAPDSAEWKYYFTLGEKFVYHIRYEREGDAMINRGLRKYRERMGVDLQITVAHIKKNVVTLDIQRLGMHDTIAEGDPSEWNAPRIPIPPHSQIQMTTAGLLSHGVILQDDSLRDVSRDLAEKQSGSQVNLLRDHNVVSQFLRPIFPGVMKSHVHSGMEWIDSIKVQNASTAHEEVDNIPGQKDQKIRAVCSKLSQEGATHNHIAFADSAGERLMRWSYNRDIVKAESYKNHLISDTQSAIRLRDGIPLYLNTEGTVQEGDTKWFVLEDITLTSEQ